MNVDATLHGVLNVVHSHVKVKVLHTVLMFDEIAAERRIRWDPKTNFFLGVCRQHASRTSMEFINEGDLEELYRHLDDGDVHYAGEVRKICFGKYLLPRQALTPDSNLGHCRSAGNSMQGQPHISWTACPCIWGLQARIRATTCHRNSNSPRWCEFS